jgi:ABC-2 type transport system permease protein
VNVPGVRLAQRRGTTALAEREVRRVLSLWTQTILPPALTATLFLAVFGGALGRRIDEVEGVPYTTFILPGLLVMAVAGPAFSNASTSLFQAKSEGYVDDLLTSPLVGRHLVAAFVSGSLVRSLAAAAIATVAAAPFIEPIESPAVAVVALFLTGIVFSALGVVTGVWAETFDQHSFIANIVIAPLALVGGVFYSARTLDEPWSTLTRIDPLYYLVDAARGGFTGVHEAPVWISLAVAAAVACGALVAAAALIDGGWRLKP